VDALSGAKLAWMSKALIILTGTGTDGAAFGPPCLSGNETFRAAILMECSCAFSPRPVRARSFASRGGILREANRRAPTRPAVADDAYKKRFHQENLPMRVDSAVCAAF
jgi:hypothetical protein